MCFCLLAVLCFVLGACSSGSDERATEAEPPEVVQADVEDAMQQSVADLGYSERSVDVFSESGWVVRHTTIESAQGLGRRSAHFLLLGKEQATAVVDLWYVDLDESCTNSFVTSCRAAVRAEIARRDSVVPATSAPAFVQRGDLWPRTEWAWVPFGTKGSSCEEATLILQGTGGTQRPILGEPIGRVVDVVSSADQDLSLESVHVVTFHAVLTACGGQGVPDPYLYVFRTVKGADWEGAPIRSSGPDLVGRIPMPGAERIADFTVTGTLSCPWAFDVGVVADGTRVPFRFGSDGVDLHPVPERSDRCD